MTFIIVFTTFVKAQQSEEADKVSDPCEIQVAPIDSRELATNPDRTKARIIAQMLLDMDRCIGGEAAGFTSVSQSGMQGASTGSLVSQQSASSQSSDEATERTPSTTRDGETSIETAIANSDASDATNDDLDDTTQSSNVWHTTIFPSTSLPHNTSILDIGSDDELVLDDYAKTLHEAYLAETDPVLKEALGKELTNYLNNKKK